MRSLELVAQLVAKKINMSKELIQRLQIEMDKVMTKVGDLTNAMGNLEEEVAIANAKRVTVESLDRDEMMEDAEQFRNWVEGYHEDKRQRTGVGRKRKSKKVKKSKK